MKEKKLISEEEYKAAVEDLIKKVACMKDSTLADGVKLSAWAAWIQWRLFAIGEEPEMPTKEKVDLMTELMEHIDNLFKFHETSEPTVIEVHNKKELQEALDRIMDEMPDDEEDE